MFITEPDYKCVIRSLALSYTQGCPKMYNRQFKLSCTNNDKDSILNMVGDLEQGVNRRIITNQDLVYNTPNLITLDKEPTPIHGGDGSTFIPYGWEEKRWIFLLTVEVMPTDSTDTHIYYFQGYSEFLDASYTGKVDPNMILFINTITHVHTINPHNSSTPIYRTYTVHNVLTDTRTVYSQRVDNVLSDIKPETVLNTIQSKEQYYGVDVEEPIAMLNVTSSRDNNNPEIYFSRIINSLTVGERAVLNSTQLQENSPNVPLYNSNKDSIYRNAKQYLNSTDVSNVYKNATLALDPTRASEFVTVDKAKSLLRNPFLIELSNALEDAGEPPLYGYSFPFRCLTKIDPDLLVSKTTIFHKNQYQPDIDISSFQSNKLAYIENVVTHYILLTVPDYMTKMMLYKIHAIVSWDIIEGRHTCKILNSNSYIEELNTNVGLLHSRAVELENVINENVLPKITASDQVHLSLNMEINTLGFTTIKINYNNHGSIDFLYPTYADSIYSPMVTDLAIRRNMESDIHGFVNAVFGFNNAVPDPFRPANFNDTRQLPPPNGGNCSYPSDYLDVCEFPHEY